MVGISGETARGHRRRWLGPRLFILRGPLQYVELDRVVPSGDKNLLEVLERSAGQALTPTLRVDRDATDMSSSSDRRVIDARLGCEAADYGFIAVDTEHCRRPVLGQAGSDRVHHRLIAFAGTASPFRCASARAHRCARAGAAAAPTLR